MLVCIMSAMMSESDLLVCIPQGRIKVVPLRGKDYRCIQKGLLLLLNAKGKVSKLIDIHYCRLIDMRGVFSLGLRYDSHIIHFP